MAKELKIPSEDLAQQFQEELRMSIQEVRSSGFQYRPLETKDDIRLLYILPGQFDDELCCVLRHVNVAEATPAGGIFEALSYAWGNPKLAKVSLKLAYWDTGIEDVSKSDVYFTDVPVTPSLESALRHFRDHTTKLALWADAICINQDDVQEKEVEVLKMGKIYSLASTVRVWLGVPAEISPKLLEESGCDADTCHRAAFNWFDRYSATVYPPETAKADQSLQPSLVELLGLCDVLSRPWFSRLWVLQEVLLAQTAQVYCGTRNTTLRAVLNGGVNICRVCKKLNRMDLANLAFRTLHFDSAHQYFALARQSKLPLPDMLLGGLLRTGKRLGASILPHDRIYGMLGLLGDVKGVTALEPDYEKPRDLFLEDLARYIILSTGTGAVLCGWSEDDKTSPRSWAPAWQHTGGYPAHLSLERASKLTRVHFSDCGELLHINASVCGSIHYCTPIDSSLFLSRELTLQMFRKLEADLESADFEGRPCDAIADCLVKEFSPFEEIGDHPERLKIFLGRSAWPGSLTRPSKDEAEDESRLFAYLQGSREMFTQLQLYMTSKGIVGTCGLHAQLNDVVYWIPGCRSPLAFRKEPMGLNIVDHCHVRGFKRWSKDEEPFFAFLESGSWEDITIV